MTTPRKEKFRIGQRHGEIASGSSQEAKIRNYLYEAGVLVVVFEKNTEILLQFSHADAKAIMSLIFNSLFSQEMKKIRKLSNNNSIPKVVYIRW